MQRAVRVGSRERGWRRLDRADARQLKDADDGGRGQTETDTSTMLINCVVEPPFNA